MDLLKFLEHHTCRIVGGDEYAWNCYGEGARYLDFENNVGIVFRDFQIYEISVNGGAKSALWRHPDYRQAYNDEMKERRAKHIAREAQRSSKSTLPEILAEVDRIYAV
jgi:hypothetical protein